MVDTIKVLDGDGVARTVATNDALATLLTNALALLTTQATYLDGLEGLITVTNASLVTSQGRAVAQLGTRTVAQSPAVNIATDQPAIPVDQVTGGRGSTTTITRPANTTAYAAGAVVGGALTLSALGPAGGTAVMITGSRFEMDIAALPAGIGNMRLYLYSSTPPSALADGAVWDLPSGDRATFLGYVDLGTPVDLGSTLYVQQDALSHQCKLTGTDLFGYLVTTAGYTPGSGDVYKLTVHDVTV